MIVKKADAPCVVRGFRSLLSGLSQIDVRERFKTDEDSGAAGQGHLANKCGIIGNIDREGRTPDLVERAKRVAQHPQVVPARAEIVVDEYRVRLVIRCELV